MFLTSQFPLFLNSVVALLIVLILVPTSGRVVVRVVDIIFRPSAALRNCELIDVLHLCKLVCNSVSHSNTATKLQDQQETLLA